MFPEERFSTISLATSSLHWQKAVSEGIGLKSPYVIKFMSSAMRTRQTELPHQESQIRAGHLLTTILRPCIRLVYVLAQCVGAEERRSRREKATRCARFVIRACGYGEPSPLVKMVIWSSWSLVGTLYLLHKCAASPCQDIR